MAYRVARSQAADEDLAAIFDFLLESSIAFCDSGAEALERAAARVEGIETEMLALGDFPHHGSLRSEILPGLRSITKRRAIFHFYVDDDVRLVRVLAVFFGGKITNAPYREDCPVGINALTSVS